MLNAREQEECQWIWVVRVRQPVLNVFLLLVSAVVTACQKPGPNTAELQKVAQFYVDHGGLMLDTSRANAQRPCLQGLILNHIVVGGPFGISETLVNFIRQEKLATVTKSQTAGGVTHLQMAPAAAYKDNWVDGAEGGLSYFCFGQLEVVKVEPVADTKPITAGPNEPYLVPGTTAHATRVTYKLTNLPTGMFLDDLKKTLGVLTTNAMPPTDYGLEKTVVVVLPEKIENIQLTP